MNTYPINISYTQQHEYLNAIQVHDRKQFQQLTYLHHDYSLKNGRYDGNIDLSNVQYNFSSNQKNAALHNAVSQMDFHG